MNKFIAVCVHVATVTAFYGSAGAQSSLVAQATGPGAFSLNSGTTPQTASVSSHWEPPADPLFSYSAYASALGFGALNSSSNNLQLGGWFTTLGTRTSANAAWYDDFVVNPTDPLLLGTAGTLSVTVRVTGSVSAGYSSAGLWTETSDDVPTAAAGIAVYLNGGFLTYTNDFVQARGLDQSVAQSIDRTEVLTIPIVFGQWFNLGINLATISSIESLFPQPNNIASASSSANATCLWGGVNGVSSPDGPMSSADYLLTSASGTDYAAAIPSPGVSLVLSLMGLGTTRRRR